MATQKYADEKAIKEKIQKLFDDRKLTDLLQVSRLNKDKEFISHLIEIQYRIYQLDAYLEGRWELKKDELGHFWEEINVSLAALNYTDLQIKSMVGEIKEYERIERNCRKDKWPTRETFRKFYTTKSCDVRLMRHLIYSACPEIQNHWKEKSWLYYDLVTEVNDDISDLPEDITTFNGNRFLISILRKGSDKTIKQYQRFLMNMSTKAKVYFKNKPNTPENKKLYDWTMSRCTETRQILDQTNKNLNPDTLSSAVLLQYMQ